MKTLKLILYFITTVLLTAVIPFSNILMPFTLVLSTALFVALAVKWHVLYAVFSAAFAGLLFYFFSTIDAVSGVISAITFPAISLISALGIYIALKKRSTIKTVLLAGTTGLFALIVVIYFIYGGSFVADIINIAKTYMIETLDSVIASLPTESAIVTEEMKQFYDVYFENLKVIAPAIILSFIFLISYFSIKMSSYFAKNEPEFSVVPPFSEIRSPAFFVLIAFFSYFGQLIENSFISGLMANVFMMLSVYLTLCGCSFIDFLVKLRIKNIFARIGFYLGITIILTLVSAFLYFANPVLIAMFIGIADSMFNYRTRIKLMRGK